MTPEEAEAIPLPVRVKAWAVTRGLSDLDAVDELLELGLERAAEDFVLADPKANPPIYLWKSMRRLHARLEAERGAEGGSG